MSGLLGMWVCGGYKGGFTGGNMLSLFCPRSCSYVRTLAAASVLHVNSVKVVRGQLLAAGVMYRHGHAHV